MAFRKRIGIRDIAEKANVSIGTVDRVLHNRPEVSENTRKKVLKIIEEYKYRPNLLAQRLASDKIFRFAILIPKHSRDNTYWKRPLAGIQKAEKEIAGYGILSDKYFFDLQDENSFRKETLNVLTNKPDGIILAPVFGRESKEFIRKCDNNNIPCVFIDSYIEDQNNLSYFGQDPIQSGYLAGKLLSYKLRKHSEILIFNFSNDLKNHPHFLHREEGLRKYFHDINFKGKIKSIRVSSRKERELSLLLPELIHHRTRGIFVTSSAHKIAAVISQTKKRNKILVGYDLTSSNIKYLKEGTIDFLICQKPVAQGYNALMALFDHLVQKTPVKKDNPMPLEIITKENYQYYLDFEK